MTRAPFSLRYAHVTVTCAVVCAMWGVISLCTLPRQEAPRITWRLANVITRLPGSPPARIEQLVTDVLEHSLKQVDEVEHIYSVSRSGVSLIQIELSDNVTTAAPVWQKVRHQLEQATHTLPTDIIGPELDDEIMGTQTALIAVTHETPDFQRLRDLAQALEDKVRFLPDTASTELYGVQQEVVHVEPASAKLAAYKLSFREFASRLQHRNTRNPSGRMRVNEAEVVIETSGELDNETQLLDMVVLTDDAGGVVRVRDVASVQRTIQFPPAPLARINGRPAVVLGVRARDTCRLDEFVSSLQHIAATFRSTLPAGYQLEFCHDLGRYTRERERELGTTLAWSVAMVFLATCLFMGWRGATIVTLSIPLTCLISVIVFQSIGIPLNEMSAMAVIMSLGLLVDNSVVITDEIQRGQQTETNLREVVAHSITTLWLPLFVSTLTTVSAFLPIYLLPGGTGEFVRAIPLGVTICLLVSLVVSLNVVPLACHWGIRRAAHLPTPRLFGLSAKLSSLVTRTYVRLLRWTLRSPRSALLTILPPALLLAALGLALRRDFFSPVQRDQFVIDVLAPQGSALLHTADVAADIEQLLSQEEYVDGFSSWIGRNVPLIFYNLVSQETYANHYAQILVQTTDWRHTAKLAQRVQDRLQSEIAGADCVVHTLEHGAPFIAPFEVRISGHSVPELRELGSRAAGLLRQYPDVRGITTNFGNESLKLVAQVNEPVARLVGLDQLTVAAELNDRIDGLPASIIREGDEQIPIIVRAPMEHRNELADLESVYFKPTGNHPMIPLSVFMRFEPTWENSSIYRRDGQRTLSVLGYPEFGRTAAQVSREFLPQLKQFAASLPDGFRLELGGENEQREDAESNLIRRAVYAIGLVVFFLMVEFRSVRLVTIILLIVPLSVGGTMLALWLTGWPLNFMAIMGMIMLIGIVVNDAVILIDGFQHAPPGATINEQIEFVTRDRARHVIITTVTTLAGFAPLAISPSLLWPPLALAIIGGLSLSTLLTLLAIPAAYATVVNHNTTAHSSVANASGSVH